MKKIFFVWMLIATGTGFAVPVTYSYEAPYSCSLKDGNPETGVLKDSFVLDSDKNKDARNPKTEAALQAGNKLNAKFRISSIKIGELLCASTFTA